MDSYLGDKDEGIRKREPGTACKLVGMAEWTRKDVRIPMMVEVLGEMTAIWMMCFWKSGLGFTLWGVCVVGQCV